MNGRLEPASIVNGFTAEIGASGSFCPNHKTLPVTVFFYAFQDSDKGEKISSPYLVRSHRVINCVTLLIALNFTNRDISTSVRKDITFLDKERFKWYAFWALFLSIHTV